MPDTLSIIPALLLDRIPQAERAAYASQWGSLSEAEKTVVWQTYAPDLFRTVPRVRFPWRPFAGAYMAPVPEVAPTSAITINDQIPPDILANIPANQRQAYVQQWPIMNEGEKQVVRQTYGSGATPNTERNSVMFGASPSTIPAEVLANIPADQRQAYADQWAILSDAEKAVVIQTYSAAPAQMGFLNNPLVIVGALAVAAWWYFKGRR